MKIVYICHNLHEPGGVSRVISVKANLMADRGFEVFLISAARDNSFYYPVNSKIQTVNLFDKSSCNKKRDITPYRKALEQYLLKIRAEICITIVYSEEFYFLPSIKDGSKKIAEFHGTFHFAKGFTNWRYNLRKYIYERIFFQNIVYHAKKYDRFIVLTKGDVECWRKYIKNVLYIYNPKTIFPEIRANLGSKNVIAVGRIDQVKRFDWLLTAWSKIDSDNWSLQIYGDGLLKKNLIDFIEKKELGNVYFHQAQPDLTQAYAQSSIHVMTSEFEGLSLVLIEAMSFGIPTVSFQTQVGPMEVIEDSVTGKLVKKGDTSAFAETLSSVMNDKNLRTRLGNAAYEKSKIFAQEKVAEQWITLFKTLTQISDTTNSQIVQI